jgi:predicted dehydrogenase
MYILCAALTKWCIIQRKTVENYMVKAAILGCGQQGLRRAKAVQENGDEVAIVADIDEKKADHLSVLMGCEASNNWKTVVASTDIEVVIVCSPNYLHAPMSIAALKNGKHVLCEKPMGTSFDETKQIVNAAAENGKVLKCGYNHRYHPAINQVKKWFDEGTIGELSFIRCRYGTCGRIGYDKEWRAIPKLSGGGELLDQGSHVLDLFLWFAGKFSEVIGYTSTLYWDCPVEDNAFALLRTGKGQVATMHVSWTQWNNLFSFELFGKNGYLKAEGLGGSYGTERAIRGKRSFTDPFTEQIVDFRGDDISWRNEWREFTDTIESKRKSLESGVEGLEVMRLIQAIYQSSIQKCSVDPQSIV